MKGERIIKLKVKIGYLDMELDRMVNEGEVLEVPESRARQILLAKYADVIFIPKLIQ